MSLTVNGERIPEEDIRREVTALRIEAERGRELTAERGRELTLEERIGLRVRAIASLVDRAVIFQEARSLGLAPSQAEIAQNAEMLVPHADGMPGCRPASASEIVRNDTERRLIFDRMIAHWTRGLKRPSAAGVKEYYRNNLLEFEVPEMVHAVHIARNHEPGPGMQTDVPGSVLLESLRERMIAGEDPAALAARFSDCPEDSGDLGLFPRGVMVEEFDRVVFASPPGEWTPPFRTRLAWHIALVRENRPARRMSFNEATPLIEAAMHRVAMDREVGRQLEALRTKAVIIR